MSAFEPTLANFEDVLREREDNVDRIALEKDWYLVQSMKLLSDVELPPNCAYVFTGGTSLSKRGLISRFSEDADFILFDPNEQLNSRPKRRAIRKSIVAKLRSNTSICASCEDESRDDGRQMIINISYPSVYQASEEVISVRPHIRLEIRVSHDELAMNHLEVRSLVAETLSDDAELTLGANDPVKIAADKLVGLGWRVIKREQSHPTPEDRNLVRHIHDLAALEAIIQENKERFCAIFKATVEADRPRFTNKEVTARDLILQTTHLITEQTNYEEEYKSFVEKLSFAPDNERISYEQAASSFRKIVDLVTGK